MKKHISALFILVILGANSLAQDKINYIEKSMEEIVDGAIKIALEHVDLEDLEDLKEYSTIYYDTYYMVSATWSGNTVLSVADEESFKTIKDSYIGIGRRIEDVEEYKYYIAFGWDNEITIVFVFSRYLKDDFEEWVENGDIVEYFLQLASFELKSKVFIFFVNKYKV